MRFSTFKQCPCHLSLIPACFIIERCEGSSRYPLTFIILLVFFCNLGKNPLETRKVWRKAARLEKRGDCERERILFCTIVEEGFRCFQCFICLLGEIEVFLKLNACAQACLWRVVAEDILTTLTKARSWKLCSVWSMVR